jgi:homoserine/homoserine lactone efflux protein
LELVAGLSLERFMLYVVAELFLSLSPGPAVLLVLATAIARGLRVSVGATLGILTANTLYFAISATGLGAVIAASATLFAVLKWAGAAYLAYLGLAALLGRSSPLTISHAALSSEKGLAASFSSGLFVQLSNPKAILFFVALLPQFFNPAHPVGPQMVWLAAGSVLPEFFILLGYGWLAARARHEVLRPATARGLDCACGAMLLAVAALVLRAESG